MYPVSIPGQLRYPKDGPNKKLCVNLQSLMLMSMISAIMLKMHYVIAENSPNHKNSTDNNEMSSHQFIEVERTFSLLNSASLYVKHISGLITIN